MSKFDAACLSFIISEKDDGGDHLKSWGKYLSVRGKSIRDMRNITSGKDLYLMIASGQHEMNQVSTCLLTMKNGMDERKICVQNEIA